MKRDIGEFTLEILGAYPWYGPSEKGLKAMCKITGNRVNTRLCIETKEADGGHYYSSQKDSALAHLFTLLLDEMSVIEATSTSQTLIRHAIGMAEKVIARDEEHWSTSNVDNLLRAISSGQIFS